MSVLSWRCLSSLPLSPAPGFNLNGSAIAESPRVKPGPGSAYVVVTRRLCQRSGDYDPNDLQDPWHGLRPMEPNSG
jgi:hypothetical protein